jgi:hypothetical protein
MGKNSRPDVQAARLVAIRAVGAPSADHQVRKGFFDASQNAMVGAMRIVTALSRLAILSRSPAACTAPDL